MKIYKLRKTILECTSDITFKYCGKLSGITSEVHNGIITFQMWHGDNAKDYDNVDKLLTDKFFNGKSIMDIVDKVSFTGA